METMEEIRLMVLDMQRWKAEKCGRQQLAELKPAACGMG